ncbi:MAG: copper resistance system multicopper oxidase [Alphaproteobacteria bacterium]|nr:copper resistance system multicopper oxidase [Alphaproteobacteria bacterium]
MKRTALFLMMFYLFLAPVSAKAGEYNLTIARETVNVTGHPVKKLTVNGTTPGPVLHFTEGEDVAVHVTNTMKEPTSIHWHGFLIDGAMDGVPGFNGFPGIMPGETFTYRFKVRQNGTYWYHSHSQMQEQDGIHGGIVITPKGKDPVQADRDYVVLLSDFSDEDGRDILSHLKMMSDYYNYARRTVGDFITDANKKGFGAAWEDTKMWNQMRMSPSDLSDVSGYTFLMNGKTPEQNWTGLFKPGERVRLRFINASAMSFYDVRIPGLKMQVVAADGQNVEPVPVDEFRFGVAETYDAIVTPKEDKAFTIVAEPIDRTGFALGTLAPREGMKGEIPQPRPRAQLTMFDMNMENMMKDMPDMDMSSEGANVSGWARAGTPEGDKALSYHDLRYRGTQKDTRQPDREILVRLGGNMERYIWTMNGKKYEDSGPMKLRYGERVRLKFVNDTMMAHPMHLHGMFVQLENGQPMEKLPNKHTVIIPPGQSYSVLLTADEAGEWAFHCHLLYHMMSGMMTKVVVAKLDPSDIPASAKAKPYKGEDSANAGGMGMDHDMMMDMPGMDHSHMDHSTMNHSMHGGH